MNSFLRITYITKNVIPMTMENAIIDYSVIKSFQFLNERDECNECNEVKTILQCNKCGNSICTSRKCSLLFPHYFNSIFAVCNSCRLDIEGKLKISIDVEKLKLLKKKIKLYKNRKK